ncbi:hypothetical protein [Paraferrimonas sp. SM1919]|uniref:hypothetical protein n=1 Tax=Paraferrimonas sp. SM1919 TaxID=2662263 RepID=UPI0013D1575B|nr:hypothetical protein [Paraferrimonas sp. SM1919]
MQPIKGTLYVPNGNGVRLFKPDKKAKTQAETTKSEPELMPVRALNEQQVAQIESFMAHEGVSFQGEHAIEEYLATKNYQERERIKAMIGFEIYV